MNKPLLVDTHIWIWFVMGSPELQSKDQDLITQALRQQSAYLAAISLWEIAMLDKKQRIILDMPCLTWVNTFMASTPIQIVSLSPEIAIESCNLPNFSHNDPADRMITATARIKNLKLVTRDERILEYGKKGFVLTHLA